MSTGTNTYIIAICVYTSIIVRMLAIAMTIKTECACVATKPTVLT